MQGALPANSIQSNSPHHHAIRISSFQPQSFVHNTVLLNQKTLRPLPARHVLCQSNTMAQPKSRLPLYLGATVAGGVGYYLYNAGGNPKVAEKQFESDLSKASAKIKSEVPGQTKKAEKETEKLATEAGAKVDSYVDKTRAELAKAEGKLEQYGKDAKKDALDKIDQADRKIEEASAKAKSGISSWFGGK